MKPISLRSSLICACLVCFGVISSLAQNAPVCDITCSPDTGASGYGSVAAARPKLLNARGYSNRIAPKVTPLGMQASVVSANGNDTNIGSQAYNYEIPVLNLPGRAGLDLNLSMYYNSRIWDVDTAGGTITFNADRDFPSYGFRLDFGFIEYDPAVDEYILTEADGAKRALPNSGGSYDTIDGSFINYNPVTKTLTYKNGTVVFYEPFYSQQSANPPELL